MSTKQSLTPTKSKRTTFTGNSEGTMARNQYRHDRTIIKFKRNGCHIGYCGSIHEDDQAKGNNDEHFIRRDHKNLQRQDMETTWSTKDDSQ